MSHTISCRRLYQAGGGLIYSDRAFLLTPKNRQFDAFGQRLRGELWRTFAFGGIFIHLVQYLMGIGYAQAAGTMVVSFSLGLAVIGKPVMGVLGDRIGGKNALALCLLIGAVNTALLLLAREFWALVVFTFVGGITGAAPIALGPLVQVDTLGLRRYGSVGGLLGIAFTRARRRARR